MSAPYPYQQSNTNVGYAPPQVNPEMLKFGLSAGQDMLNKQYRDRWMPGLTSFWISLKYYFAVSNLYVVKKMRILVYPIAHKSWNRVLADEFDSPSVESEISSRKYGLPKQDVNSPDLYIPLMAFTTYVLLYGLIRGSSSFSGDFTPEVLTQAVWRGLFLQLVESAVIKVGVNVLSSNLSFLDIFAYTGYKYVGLCINITVRILGIHSLNFIVSVYTAAMLAYFVLKTMAAVIPPLPNNSGLQQQQLLLLLITNNQNTNTIFDKY